MYRVPRRSLAIALALSCAASTARAGILHLRWDACGTDGATATSFACDTNTGSHQLIGSFQSPIALSDFGGMLAFVAFTFSGGALPEWWNAWALSPSPCRGGAFTTNFFHDDSWTACGDFWNGLANGGISTYAPDGLHQAPGCTSYILKIAVAAPVGALAAGQETFGFRVIISNAKTVGAGACGGCTLAGNIELVRLDLDTASGPQPAVQIEGSSDGGHLAVWQSPATCQSVPVRNRTWGAIKSLYR